ncbi:DMT family transporter [Ostreibacterium oceani]|uniref:EamA family transporter n=1 Tax=Ostreibacterium oceani TaxID=2654998 RepID=A0A6N7EY65_9GAMM|nr:DMT family transporter [Ostreibacterium oceani]MPV86490.1 EamA family transporter [Ostreibacterium oceani]
MLWAFITVFAALMQALRNAGQKTLGTHLPVLIVTWVRFAFGLPIAAGLVLLLFADKSPANQLQTAFLSYAAIAALAQFSGALCAVKLLNRRNFAVGATLVKSETLFAALLSLFLLGESLSLVAWLSVAIGVTGVFIISVQQANLDAATLIKKLDTPSAGLGLLSGLLFAIAAIYIRKANLSLTDSTSYQAASLTLLTVLFAQSLLGGCYIALLSPTLFKSIRRHLKACLFIGTVSVLGSFGWFWAYALQNITLVKTLGHLEILFAMAITWRYFREKIHWLEYLAILMIVGSSLLVIWL